MSVQERDYMSQPTGNSVGIVAKSEQEAAKILNWQCPTQDAEGKWHRVTIALSLVPVCELYNVLSNIGFVASRLREIQKNIGGDAGDLAGREAAKLEQLKDLLINRDRVNSKPIVFDGANIHEPKASDDKAS